MDSLQPAPEPAVEIIPSDAPPSPKRRTNLLREIVDTALLTAIIFLLVNAATSRFQIESVSMLPTLYEGERLIVDKVSYQLAAPQRGDIIVFELADEPKDLIKRVIGLPGETLEVLDGAVYIDGLRIDEPYIQFPSHDSYPARRLDADEYFVMGDNRANSRDSRSFGPIHLSNMIGRAWIIYWPVANWGLVTAPAYATNDAP